ncbi:MAG: electron transfer flavoprotein subunit alpha/FixB family protein [Ignavibacteria bacterium]|nr:electron transfer flavoprotein subunit alpha/FixB family protein [Ignavibacteria bacterium]
MKILVFAEQREGNLKKSALEITSAGKMLATQLNAEVEVLLVGNNVASLASQLNGFGAVKILVGEDARLQTYSTTAYAKAIADVAKQRQANIVLLSASQMGKDLSPRVAVKLEAGLAADCTALKVENGDIVATRPIYAGKAMIDVKVTTATKVFSLRPNVFSALTQNGNATAVEKISLELSDADFSVKAISTSVASGRPDLTEANIVVSGGRGMKGPEHFTLIEQLADAFGGAVGASRAVVDAGWRAHDEQVGQTGKTVSPSLYVACGISGAVQHLAGMSSSKCIVAINKDKDAPIFQIADYGIVGDVFAVLPPLTQEIKKVTGL